MTQIIGITGLKRSGKDTLADYLMGSLPVAPRYSNLRYSFAQPIYRMVETLVGKNLPRHPDGDYIKEAVVEPYDVTLRHMLQSLGTEWGRRLIHEDIWVMYAERELRRILENVPQTLFVLYTDIRFDNEAEFVKRHGGTIVMVQRDTVTANDPHASESAIAEDYVDLTVYNNGSLQAFNLMARGLAATLAKGNHGA